MKDTKIIVIGNNLKDKDSIYTYLASKQADIIIVDSIEDVNNLLGYTTYPKLTNPEPFIITAPPIYERPFEDYESGQEKRRRLRADKRNKTTR